MGVVVRRYIDILTIIITLVLALFWAAASLLICSFVKCFVGLVSVINFFIANVTQRTFEIVIKNRGHANILLFNYIHN